MARSRPGCYRSESGPVPSSRAALPRRLLGTIRLVRDLPGQAGFLHRRAALVRRDQERRLRRMVAHAFRHVPYYGETMRRLGIDPDGIRTVSDLARLPILERSQLQRDPDFFRSRARPLADLLELRSGGSSGAPLSVFHDPDALLQNTAHGEREVAVLRSLVGRRRFRMLCVASTHGTETDVRATVRAHAWIPGAAEGERTNVDIGDSPEFAARRLDATRADVVAGYGSYLDALAQVLEREPGLHRPRVVAYGGDALPEPARGRMVERLGLRVWSSYQAIESFKIGFECGHGTGLHLHADLAPLRIVDDAGAEVPVGTPGSVILSNLVNTGSVILNYRLGDVAALLPGTCPCGSTLPLLSFPLGRVEDWLALPGGRRLHSQRLRSILGPETLLWEFQVVQEAADHVRVLLVKAAEADAHVVAERVGPEIRDALGHDVRVDLVFVDAVERTAGGKVRTIVRRGDT